MTKIPSDTDVLSYAWKAFGCHPVQLLPRETVREVRCPSCHAEPGFPCFGRTSNHSERCFERIRLLMLSQPEMCAEPVSREQIQIEDEVALSPEEWQKLSSLHPAHRVQSKS